jgi:hypothetical protein
MLNAVLCLESSLEFDNAGRLVCAEAVNESAP